MATTEVQDVRRKVARKRRESGQSTPSKSYKKNRSASPASPSLKQNSCWIENSFMPGKRCEVSSKIKQGESGVELNLKVRSSGTISSSGQDSTSHTASTGVTPHISPVEIPRCDTDGKESEVCVPECGGGSARDIQLDVNDGILTRVPSTPEVERQPHCSTPMAKVVNSPDVCCHDSFNDSDSLFAELDLQESSSGKIQPKLHQSSTRKKGTRQGVSKVLYAKALSDHDILSISDFEHDDSLLAGINLDYTASVGVKVSEQGNRTDLSTDNNHSEHTYKSLEKLQDLHNDACKGLPIMKCEGHAAALVINHTEKPCGDFPLDAPKPSDITPPHSQSLIQSDECINLVKKTGTCPASDDDVVTLCQDNDSDDDFFLFGENGKKVKKDQKGQVKLKNKHEFSSKETVSADSTVRVKHENTGVTTRQDQSHTSHGNLVKQKPNNTREPVDVSSVSDHPVSSPNHVCSESDLRATDICKNIGDPSVVTTPISRPSLKDRIKKTLQKNASTPTGTHVFSKLQQLREETLQHAIEEASKIQHQGSEHDIGPFYGLPSKVKELFEQQRGIGKLYDWQHECLSLPAVQAGKNLIYSLPTSGGKTLVAEILILRELLCKKRDAVLILPFVSIVQEKVRNLSTFAVDLDFLVEEYAAGKGVIPPKKRRSRKSLYICTIEKASGLVNSLIELGRHDSVGLVVVDELHMLGEGGSRGAVLEMTLAKIRHSNSNTQIIGMSATLSNITDLSKFLNAEVYSNDFRPVELREYVKLGEALYETKPKALVPEDRMQLDRFVTFQYDANKNKQDPDHLAGLVLEVIPDHSCLLFCPTKKNCENVAELICKLMPVEMTSVQKDKRKGLLKVLWHEGSGRICPVLRRTIPYGVAYHHSGLTMDERKLVEEAYSDGTLCLLTCTSTLAAGVNLPAKRVILRSPYVGDQFLSRSQYKQMVGRAGRAGLDSSGESILILKIKDKKQFLDLLEAPSSVCYSSLMYEDSKGLRRLLLSTVGLKITNTVEEVRSFLKKTLCYVQQSSLSYDLVQAGETALQSLRELDLISHKYQSADPEAGEVPVLEVTNLGRATFKGAIDVDRAPGVYQDLCAAQQSLVVANYLHLLYLVTPHDLVHQASPDWMVYFEQMSQLDQSELKVAALLGITEAHITRKASGQRSRKVVDEFVVKRFYLTLMLYSLWKQRTIWDVAMRFKLPRGFIQSLLSSAAAFASCTLHFCQELEEFWAFQDLLSGFVKKLTYCCSAELLPLIEIPGVKLGRARQLYNAGYKTLQQVSYAEPLALVKAIEHMPKKAAKQIVAAAQLLLTEKAEALRDEAEEIIAMPTDVTSTQGKVTEATDSQLSAIPLSAPHSQEEL